MRSRIELLEFQKLDISKPNVAAMVLEADVARSRVVFVNNIELMIRSVWAFVNCRPFVEVSACNFRAVDFYGDQVLIATDEHIVPLARRFHRILGRRNEIVKSPRIVEAIGFGVVYRYFDTVEAHIFSLTRFERKCADEDAAIALGADLKIER